MPVFVHGSSIEEDGTLSYLVSIKSKDVCALRASNKSNAALAILLPVWNFNNFPSFVFATAIPNRYSCMLLKLGL